ncbi:HU family DNA-binding protein [bacterium]|nr:HU family DNA-binding protein [bacterium]|tara:strand:+ start:1523 stop:1825 length:303 start_codon:yes stop_codon:yes gene_type:complete
MTKKDLANILNKNLGISLKETSKIVDKFFDTIVKNLSEGKDIKLPGFGSIKIQERKSRLGRNPTTGDPIEIAERKAIVFRPSKNLKKKLNYKSDGEDSNV